MTCFAPCGLALIVAMQTPAAATESPDLKVVIDDTALDEDPDRGSSLERRRRRDPADVAPRFDPRPRLRDRDRDRRPARRSDAANDRPRLKDSDERPKRVTAIMRLKHIPAQDAATTLTKWMELESGVTGRSTATVVPVLITNRLMVTGEPSHLEQIETILRQLDQAPPQIQIKALLVHVSLPEDAADVDKLGSFKGDMDEIVGQLKEKGDVRVLAESELLAGDNQPAFVLVGNRVPRVTGTTNTGRGRTKSVNFENVGTILGVTARVADDERISLEVDVERSQLGPKNEGALLSADDDDEPRVQRIETLTVQTTATLRSGETAVLGGLVYQDERGRGQVVVLIQPTIRP